MSFRNLLGTTLASFKISLTGPVIYQGGVDPNTITVSPTLNSGDVYIRHGGGWYGIWTYTGASWAEVGTTIGSSISVAGDVESGGQIKNGDPTLLANWGDSLGFGTDTPGTAGLEVDRGTNPDGNTTWVWDEGNDWWTATGATDDRRIYVEDGLIVGSGSPPFSGTGLGKLSIWFAGDTDTGIYNPSPGFISFVTDDYARWTITNTGQLLPSSLSPNPDLGSAGQPVSTIYAKNILAQKLGGAVGFAFIGDTNTRIFSDTIAEMAFEAGGIEIFRIDDSTGGSILARDGGSGNPVYSFASLPSSGLYVDSGEFHIGAGGAARIKFDTAGMGHTDFSIGGSRVRLPTGTLGDPSLFMGTSITGGSAAGVGLYSPAANTIAVVTSDGTNFRDRLTIDNSGLLEVDSGINYENLVTTGGDDAIPNKKWVIDNAAGVAGANTEIQFNNSGLFGASADFTWNDGTKILGLNSSSANTITANGFLTVIGGAAGGGLGLNLNAGAEGGISMNAGTGNGATTGGAISINAGAAGSGGAGSVDIIAGAGSAADGSPNGGNATLQGGGADTGGTGGRARVIGGGGAVTGGDVILAPGSGSSTHGTVRLEPQTGGQTAPELRFEEDYGGSNNYVGLKAPASIAAPRTWTLPQDNPAISGSGNLFVTDSFGTLELAHGNNSNFPIAPFYTLGGPGLPAGAAGGFIYVADATPAIGGPGTLCFFNGTAWIDVTTSLPVV